MIGFALFCLVLCTNRPALAEAPSKLNPEPTRQTVVLLTSIDPSAIQVPWYLFFMRGYYQHYLEKLEGDFRDHFEGKGYNVVVRHYSNASTLWNALHYPGSVAVFWLSHAGSASSGVAGVSGGAMIVDWRGYDVTPVFQSVHPNLRFLGVIGCDSRQVLLEQLAARGAFAFDRALQVISFDHKIDARDGLGQALERSDAVLGTPAVERGYEAPCPERRGYEMTVTRDLTGIPKNKSVPAVSVERQGEVLGVFPPSRPGARQSLVVHLDAEQGLFRSFELKLVESAGSNGGVTSDQADVGELEFSSPWPGAHWNLFVDHDGHPIGVTTHVYHYDGPTQVDESPEGYRPFECYPMPALGR